MKTENGKGLELFKLKGKAEIFLFQYLFEGQK